MWTIPFRYRSYGSSFLFDWLGVARTEPAKRTPRTEEIGGSLASLGLSDLAADVRKHSVHHVVVEEVLKRSERERWKVIGHVEMVGSQPVRELRTCSVAFPQRHCWMTLHLPETPAHENLGSGVLLAQLSQVSVAEKPGQRRRKVVKLSDYFHLAWLESYLPLGTAEARKGLKAVSGGAFNRGARSRTSLRRSSGVCELGLWQGKATGSVVVYYSCAHSARGSPARGA